MFCIHPSTTTTHSVRVLWPLHDGDVAVHCSGSVNKKNELVLKFITEVQYSSIYSSGSPTFWESPRSSMARSSLLIQSTGCIVDRC